MVRIDLDATLHCAESDVVGLQPVQRWSSQNEPAREGAVRILARIRELIAAVTA